MHENTEINLTRDVEAIQIPSGQTLTLAAGTPVVITQSLGGSYTVASSTGLSRIQEKDADALGLTTSGEKAAVPFTAEDLQADVQEKRVWDKLKTCFDPEIPVNIVDLGLVYDCRIVPLEGKETTRAEVQMTLTAPGCGMGPSIAADAERKIMTVPGVGEAVVALVWDPPWNQHMISEAGKMKLGII
ncbi:MAG: putative Fe-S cluster assembly protein SufT [Verrucomicrobia bacterium]|nr:putative Fe-S cluster assembly protein SufT [Verrucomicrobiota bacterium]MBV9656828.1 putative Fe-S cluster assembly protein SufT [Verrucomicrobiota bacterium]